ncbi:MAG: hypothetical protein INR70_14275, partial [Parafilimonas terrae]|nr:hypothetical protein [Parafilimonas terrae]
MIHPGYAFMDVDDDPVLEPTFADGGIVRTHVARRAGPCDDCPLGRGIRPGETYRVLVELDEHGDFFSERHCTTRPVECRAAMPPDDRP